MEFYKVLYKDKDGKLYSAVRHNPLKMEYGKITHAPIGTGLFVFGYLEAAMEFSWSSHTVVYKVKVTNPRKVHKIIDYMELDQLTGEEIYNYWNNGSNDLDVSLIPPPDFTWIVSSVELLEEVSKGSVYGW